MAVMVCAPDIDSLFKASLLELVAVVGNVGGKIGRVAVGSDKNLVFEFKALDFLGGLALVCKPCAENLFVFIPECAVLFIGQPFVLHYFNGFGKLAVIVKCAFKEPCVIFNAVFCEIFFHCGNVAGQGVVNKSLSALAFGGVQIFIAVDFRKFLCSVDNILAVIAVLGQFNGIFTLEKLLISDIQRKAEFVNLIARIVNIKLTADIIARKVHNRRKAIAESAASCVAHVHGAGGVCGNKFNVYLFACAVVRTAVAFALFKNILNYKSVEAVAEIKIHKAWACDFASVKECAAELQPVCDNLSNFSRSGSEISCPCHCGV